MSWIKLLKKKCFSFTSSISPHFFTTNSIFFKFLSFQIFAPPTTTPPVFTVLPTQQRKNACVGWCVVSFLGQCLTMFALGSCSSVWKSTTTKAKFFVCQQIQQQRNPPSWAIPERIHCRRPAIFYPMTWILSARVQLLCFALSGSNGLSCEYLISISISSFIFSQTTSNFCLQMFHFNLSSNFNQNQVKNIFFTSRETSFFNFLRLRWFCCHWEKSWMKSQEAWVVNKRDTCLLLFDCLPFVEFWFLWYFKKWLNVDCWVIMVCFLIGF